MHIHTREVSPTHTYITAKLALAQVAKCILRSGNARHWRRSDGGEESERLHRNEETIDHIGRSTLRTEGEGLGRHGGLPVRPAAQASHWTAGRHASATPVSLVLSERERERI